MHYYYCILPVLRELKCWQLLEDTLDMRTQQLFHLQKALVLRSGGGEDGEGGVDQLLSQVQTSDLFIKEYFEV